MNTKNKLNKKLIKTIMTMMFVVVFLIGEVFSPFAILANAKNNGNSTQTIKVIVKDADTGERINGANVTFNGPGGSGDQYSGISGYRGICYIDVHNGSEKQVGITVNKDGYNVWNIYDDDKYYVQNHIDKNNLVVKGSWKDNHSITIELKKNSTTSNTTSSTVGSKPAFTVTMDSYTPTNPSVGNEITFNGTIHPQDFEMPIPAKEIVLVLDSSGSMGNDSKLTNLKVAARNFIDKMSTVENLKIAIVDFDTEATVVKQLTSSKNVDTLKASISNLDAGGGTNTGDGLREAAYLLNTTSTASKTIVFMSDGEPTYYNSKNNQYYTDITQQGIDDSVQIKGSGSSDANSYCLNYAKTIGAIIKDKGYNVFSIGYGLDASGTTKMQQIHDSMSSVSDNFFESDTDSIDSIFDSIANTILDTYPITDIKFNFNGEANNNVVSVDGNIINIPDFNYRKVDETSSTVKYTADPVSFNVKVKSNIVGNDIPVFTNSTVTFPWNSETISANVPEQKITVGNIDTTPPELTLTPSTTDSTSGSVEITARATDNVAVANITTPDNNTVSFEPAAINSTTYIATMNGDYIFKATDTAGNVTTEHITIDNIVSANVASKPQFTVTMDSYTPTNPSVEDEITFNGTIHPQNFQISIPEKEIVLVLDSSGSMGDNSKLTNLKIAAKNFIAKMKDVQNLKIGIVDFDTQAVCGSELIDASDVTALNSAIDNLHAGGGTNTGEGLRLGAYLLSNSSEQISTASKTIVFMSDGEPTYYNKKGSNSYYTDITKSIRDDDVVRKGTGNSDNDGSCLDYAKTVGGIIKENGYNAFSIGYGLDESGTAKMQQIHNSMSSVRDNFFESDTGSIDSVFNSIGNTILATYPITDIKFNFNPGTDTNIESVDGNTINIPDLNYKISSQTSSKVEYTADPVQFTVKIKSNVARNNIPVFINSTVTFPWKNETINAEVPTQYINVGNIDGQSSILEHGLYNGNGTEIIDKNNVTATIPVRLAMTVEAKSSNSVINWSVDDKTKITEDNIVFKKYEILDDGTIGNLQTVTLNNSGNINITGLTMESGKNYIIIYTITPVGSGQVTVTATADGTSSKSVNLNIGDKPDLF